jgi:23S rRNA pseudouridine2605 synthase
MKFWLNANQARIKKWKIRLKIWLLLLMSEKLQKVIARAGIASRRAAEKLIEDGRVKVNGQLATIGDRVTDAERIHVDGKLLRNDQEIETQVLIYNKPEGQICTRNDPEGRETIFQHLPKIKGGRWISIGRLDYNTSGLLLLTNDGELANRMMHPSFNVEREYLVRVLGEVSQSMIDQMIRGVKLDDGMAQFKSIKEVGGRGANHWFQVVLMEGRNREVRRLWESQHLLQVSRLKRIRFGSISLPRHLRQGKHELLSSAAALALVRET